MQEVLVQWDGLELDETSWERRDKLLSLFPTLNLEGKVVSQEGGNDTRISPQVINEARSFLKQHDLMGEESDGDEEEQDPEINRQDAIKEGTAVMEGRVTRNKRPNRFHDYVVDWNNN